MAKVETLNFPNIYDRDVFGPTDIPDYECEHIMSSVLLDKQDSFYSVLMALETDFNLEEKELPDNLASVSTI